MHPWQSPTLTFLFISTATLFNTTQIELASTSSTMELQGNDPLNSQNQQSVYHHDRNYSLPSTSSHTEPSVAPLKANLTRAATVSKTENLRQFSLNTTITPGPPGLATAPIHSGLQEPFMYPPPNSTGNLPAATGIQLPDSSFMGVDPNNINNSNMHQFYPSDPNMVHSVPVPMPMVDLNPAALTIPDLQSANTPQQISIPQTNAMYEPARPAQSTTQQQQTTKPSPNEGKNTSEYALHILFTQVGFYFIPYYYCLFTQLFYFLPFSGGLPFVLYHNSYNMSVLTFVYIFLSLFDLQKKNWINV